MAALFVMCPFCSRVFDAWAEPSMRVDVDRIKRVAHIKCVPVVQQEEQPVVALRKVAAE